MTQGRGYGPDSGFDYAIKSIVLEESPRVIGNSNLQVQITKFRADFVTIRSVRVAM